MNAVIERIQYILARSDKDIEYCRGEIQFAEGRLADAQGALDKAVESYNHAVKFKEEAELAVAVLRAHQG